jgi:hypothetical protein
MNSNMRHISADYYDTPRSGQKGKTVWEHIIKAETIRHAAFDHFDTNSVLLSSFKCTLLAVGVRRVQRVSMATF